MDPAQFFTASRLVIVAGKGGVGKTTVTATMARAAARHGLSSLILEVEGKSGLASMFDCPTFAYDAVTLAEADEAAGVAAISARTVTPDDALVEFLEGSGMGRISRRLMSSGALEMVSTAVPGIRDLLVLGKIKQMERAGLADLLILDAPAAGHAITFLQSASGLADAVPLGPIYAQARDVLDLLGDPERCQVVLVTLPEETPVNELVETAFQLEDRVGVSLGPVVVNGCYPQLPGLDQRPPESAKVAGTALRRGESGALTAAAVFRRERMELQAEQVDRLGAALPLPQIHLPYLFDAELGPLQLDLLAAALLDGVAALDPAAVASSGAS
ncbi:MAG: ArsA-related P-loop ATPase [Acidimicrobiales bacterium]